MCVCTVDTQLSEQFSEQEKVDKNGSNRYVVVTYYSTIHYIQYVWLSHEEGVSFI